MRKVSVPLMCGLLVCLAFSHAVAVGQIREEQTVRNAQSVLNDIMTVPLNGVPAWMLADAKGVAIFPGVIKGSFIIGARHGNGILVSRDQKGTWHAPVFMSLTGGNVGWQVGVQSTDVILVFKTDKSVQNMLAGKFTLGADAAVAAGPVGRKASAATDLQLKAEIYSYSRSRGLFAGVAIDGSVLKVDSRANANYYRSPAPGQPVVVPPSGVEFARNVACHCSPGAKIVTVDPCSQQAHIGQTHIGQTHIGQSGVEQSGVEQTGAWQPVPEGAGSTGRLMPPPALGQVDTRTAQEEARLHLAQISRDLYNLLDAQWQAYLALPAEIFSGKGKPTRQAIEQSLARFRTVATNPSYAALAARAEFQSTYGLLQHYVNVCEHRNGKLVLPAPPK